MIYQLNEDLYVQHYENKEILNSNYHDSFQKLFNDDLCSNPLIKVELLPRPCDQFISNTTS